MLEAIILGIVQGVTEFLPVSSTAHLILFPWFFNWSGEVNTLTFDVALHAGTLFALILCFWRDWIELITKKQRLFGLIVLASIPAGAAGFLLNDIIENDLRKPLIISLMLIAVGFLMLIAEKAKKYKNMEKTGLKDAIIIGIAQAIAIIPGVSRSGITISAGLFRGFEREASARFSFLLSTPIIAGATILHIKEAFTSQVNYDFKVFSIGIITSCITGFIAIKFLLNFLKKHPLNLFVYYRFMLSAVIILNIWLKG
ncbi:MAG: undecaprenyl-diphosphatase UppP [Thermodesulfovibrio sp. RBG_19FT_COMBO_42_12]|nr:MAG: undecaprenyl-diphosphatase UppP [Thermodesulfovibrio sp. RBG_19FT_COMBO_42_12]